MLQCGRGTSKSIRGSRPNSNWPASLVAHPLGPMIGALLLAGAFIGEKDRWTPSRHILRRSNDEWTRRLLAIMYDGLGAGRTAENK